MSDGDLATLTGMAGRGKIKPVIHGVYGLDDMALVHRILEEGSSTGKIVVAVDV